MEFIRLIPNIFYEDAAVGLHLFVDCLGFEILYNDVDSNAPLYILGRDTLKIHLIQDKEFAEKDRPQIRIEVDDIQNIYSDISQHYNDLLHPNAKIISRTTYGTDEFAVRDESGVCIVLFQVTN